MTSGSLFSTTSDAQRQSALEESAKNLEQFYKSINQAQGIARKYGHGGGISADAYGNDGSSGGGNSSSSSSSLINDAGGFSGLINSAKDMAAYRLGQAKDWDTFKLGQDFKYGEFANRMRMSEAGQQITGQQDLERIRQDAETGRLDKNISNQQTMQTREFDNQTTQKAQDAARARAGLFK